MSSKLTVDPRLTKVEAMLQLADEQIRKITPSLGDPDASTIAITHLASGLRALTAVVNDLATKK